MRVPTLLVAAGLSMIAVPVSAQDFLGRLAQSTAETTARRLADRAVSAATSPRPAAPAAPRSASPAQAAPRAQAPTAPPASGGVLTVRDHMPVVSSDGVRVAETMHIINGEHSYPADLSFFTADSTYMLRRLYPHEVEVRGNTVHLKMTAAQYRARSQNPERHPG